VASGSEALALLPAASDFFAGVSFSGEPEGVVDEVVAGWVEPVVAADPDGGLPPGGGVPLGGKGGNTLCDSGEPGVP